MCGILGVFGDGLEFLSVANDCQKHRGPDDSGLYINKKIGIGLGHRRLSILDLSPAGHQPMLSDDELVVLIFNGEIYNFQELRIELESKGFIFKGSSDTEVLLNMYLMEGRAMLPRLNGIFAFAIWDSRRNKLFLARDALGVKPLYYCSQIGNFAFASEIKALLKLTPGRHEVDKVALHRYLSFVWCPGSGTPLVDIHKLLPGEALEVEFGNIVEKWYWYQLPVFRNQTLIKDKNKALIGTVKYLRQAVHRQMISDAPVGAFLSGGLDSSSVVVFAREIDPEIRCFTIEMNGGDQEGIADDLPYARRVAQHLRVPLDIVKIDASSMAADLERMVVQLDEPLADPAALNALYICELARKQGIKVMLSGVGGDDLFTGYRRHIAVGMEKYWEWMPQFCRNFIKDQAANLDQRNLFSRRLTKILGGVSLSKSDRLINYYGWMKESDLLPLYTIDFKKELYENIASEPMKEFLNRLPNGLTPLEKMLGLEQRFFLSDHNLIYTDKMSMATGVEVRVPFLDLDLVEFAAKVPIKFKQHHNIGKWVLKKAMEPYLPKDVIYRPKSGFGAPLRHWMRFEFRELMNDLLSVNSLKRRGFFDPVAVQGLILANESGRQDASYTLLSLMCIEIWCRNFVDRQA